MCYSCSSDAGTAANLRHWLWSATTMITVEMIDGSVRSSTARQGKTLQARHDEPAEEAHFCSSILPIQVGLLAAMRGGSWHLASLLTASVTYGHILAVGGGITLICLGWIFLGQYSNQSWRLASLLTASITSGYISTARHGCAGSIRR